jgi:hypothetical protein
MLLFVGCAPIESKDFNYRDIEVGHGVAYDIRTGPSWYNRLFSTPHRMIVIHDSATDWQFHSEQSDSDMWSRISAPVKQVTGSIHPSVPVTPAP